MDAVVIKIRVAAPPLTTQTGDQTKPALERIVGLLVITEQ
jgi:hypothetical protein